MEAEVLLKFPTHLDILTMFLCVGFLLICLILTNLRSIWLGLWIAMRQTYRAMDKNDFRNYAALLILVNLIDRTTNPAKMAIFWADELIKELYDTETKNEV